MRQSYIIAIVFLVIMGFLPLALNSAWLAVGTTFLIFAVVAFSQDIILGRAGAFQMGHAVFFGLGAYTTAILNVHFGIPIIYTFIPAILVALVIAIILMAPIIHLKGDYHYLIFPQKQQNIFVQ